MSRFPTHSYSQGVLLLSTRTRSALRTSWTGMTPRHLVRNDGLNADSDNMQGVDSSFINLINSFRPLMDNCGRSQLVPPDHHATRTTVRASSVKKSLPPLIEGRVCAECQTHPDATFLVVTMFFSRGARIRARLAPTKTFALACDISLGLKIDVPASVI